MRTRPAALLIALSFLLVACQLQSLPSRSAKDKTSPAGEQVSATHRDAVSIEPPVVELAPTEVANAVVSEEPALAAMPEIATSEELALAAKPEVATTEIEPTSLVENVKIKVGLLLPLSGSLAREGAALLDAAQLALFDVANANFMLQPRDTGGTVDGAVRAVDSRFSF